MIRDTTKARHDAIRAEYNRLVQEEYQENPFRAKYIGKDYFLEKLISNPHIDIKDISHLRKIINKTYGRERGK